MTDLYFLFKDNLSRGNMGAIKVLQEMFPEPGRLQFIYADLGDAAAVSYSDDTFFLLFFICFTLGITAHKKALSNFQGFP